MGINVQICWEKFANYWDVEMRLVPMEGNRFTLSAEEAVKLCDENTIGVVADPRLDVRRRLRADRGDLLRARRPPGAHRPGRPRARRRRVRARSSPRSSIPSWCGTSACRGSPRSTPRATSTASSTRASDGSSGATPTALPEDLIFWVNYLGDNMPTFALNFSRPGAQVVAQYYSFLRLGFDGYRAVQGILPATSPCASRRTSPSWARSSCSRAATSCRCSRSRCGTRSTTSPRSTFRRPCASAAGRCRRTRSRRTAPTWPRCGSSCGAGSLTTWPTCWSATSSGSCSGSRSSRSRCTTSPTPSFHH